MARGSDFRGELCGLGKLEGRDKIYFSDPFLDINVKWCVKDCPDITVFLIINYFILIGT